MDIITIIICIIAAFGFIAGKFIRNLSKEEIKPGKNLLKLAQDFVFGVVLVFLFITFNLSWIISIILALLCVIYLYAKKKEQKRLSLILLSAAIASTFRTEYFLYTGGTGFIYTLIRGIRTKEWKNAWKQAALVLILSLILIYLRAL